MQKAGVIAVIALMLCACAQFGEEGSIAVGNELVFDLLAPASFGANLLLTQAVTIAHEEETYDLLFYTEITAASVAIVGLLPNGTRLFSITYDGNVISSEGNQDLLNRLDPGYLLADLQIAQWPLAEVARGFAANDCFAHGACLLQESADHLRRSLGRDGTEVIGVAYEGLPHYRYTTRYEHRERNYRLLIETLEAEALDP